MKREVELKFRVDDFAEIRKKLKNLGAKLVWKGREEDWLFDTKDHQLQKRNVILRVRKSDGGHLTWKERPKKFVKAGVKMLHEYETAISDPSVAVFIFRRLGFGVWVHYFKHREHWKLPGAVVELDTLNKKFKFVEVEASRRNIKLFAKKLGLDFAESTTQNYIQVLEKIRGKKFYKYTSR